MNSRRVKDQDLNFFFDVKSHGFQTVFEVKNRVPGVFTCVIETVEGDSPTVDSKWTVTFDVERGESMTQYDIFERVVACIKKNKYTLHKSDIPMRQIMETFNDKKFIELAKSNEIV